MAHRKQVPQPRACAQCGTTFYTARKGHVHCSNACNTRAWRQRKPLPTLSTSLAAPSPTTEEAAPAPVEQAPVTLAFNATNVGTLAVGTAMGNLLSEGVKKLFSSPTRALPSPAAHFPTWPPAELLAAAQPPRWVADPAWVGQLWLTPTTYHGHLLHLYAEAGLPYVLWQAPRGEWRVLTTPADLAQLATIRPLGPASRAIHQRYGFALEEGPVIGLPLPTTTAFPKQLGG
jgi:hypothetical protein